jgi:dUTP pyrophosphatase
MIYSYQNMPELFLLPSSASAFYKNSQLDGENAGFDLYVPTDVEFGPGERKMVSMGVKAVVTHNGQLCHYWMLPRSSISKTGLMMMNSVGVIDKSYRGELIAALWNTTDKTVVVQKGQRLVQIVAGDMSDFTKVSIVDVLPDSMRGEGGFGSSGR